MSPSGAFGGAGEVYESARRGYPPELARHLESCGLLHSVARVLDIGSGTGQLAIAVSGRAKKIVALEPEPDMVAVGEQATAALSNIAWQVGRDVDVLELFGPGRAFDLVTIGNAFHHMQRAQLLDDLDSLVTESGGVVICSSSVPVWLQDADWSRALRSTLRDEFAMAADESGVPHHDEDVAVLSASAFSTVRTWTFERDERRSVTSIVGELVSAASGVITPTRAERLHQVLSRFATQDAVIEQVTTTALTATRPP